VCILITGSSPWRTTCACEIILLRSKKIVKRSFTVSKHVFFAGFPRIMYSSACHGPPQADEESCIRIFCCHIYEILITGSSPWRTTRACEIILLRSKKIVKRSFTVSKHVFFAGFPRIMYSSACHGPPQADEESFVVTFTKICTKLTTVFLVRKQIYECLVKFWFHYGEGGGAARICCSSMRRLWSASLFPG